MKDINNLFFELTQVSLDMRICLSHTPSANEWGKLYDIAMKQSLLGVCFAGVQELVAQQQEPPEMLYLTWMGMAAKIQQRNEVVNLQCVDLQKRLSDYGLQSAILKGQGVASLYSEHLRGLRQSGDIDVWVLPNESDLEKEHIARVVRYAKSFNPKSHFSGKHIDLSVFSDTEVELHVTPAKMNCPWNERRLQEWFMKQVKGERFVVNGFKVPSIEFNLVYLLLHCYDHLLFEGVGLRQIMDYYFVLLNANKEASEGSKGFQEVSNTLKTLGLQKFAGAMMYVLKEVFGLEEQYMICEPNEKEGRFLLNEIMTGGNFGKYGKDGVMDGHAKGNVAFFMARMKRNWRFLRHYPSEIIWSPYAMLSHWIWKRTVKI